MVYYVCEPIVSCSDPPRKAERGSGVLNDFSCHMGVGLNGVNNVIIAFRHALHAACKMIPSCAVCTIALPVSNSIAPLWSTLLLLVPELELANGSLCKACFTKLKKAATFLATAENITNELREKFAFGL